MRPVVERAIRAVERAEWKAEADEDHARGAQRGGQTKQANREAREKGRSS